MLRLEIRLIREDGTIAASLDHDAMHPTDFRTPYEQPIQDGKYALYGFTYQPIVQIKLPPTR